jgi:hypothetical protein
MSHEHTFYFKGGVAQFGAETQVKFLIFFVSGKKEISLSDGRKFGFVNKKIAETPFDQFGRDAYTTMIPVVKVFLMETGGLGKPRLLQPLYLALGGGMDKQEVTITPRNETAKAKGFKFQAEARFLKASEALELLDPLSIGYGMLKRTGYSPLPINVLREIISVKKKAKSADANIAESGKRYLRL